MRDSDHHLFYCENITGDTITLDSGESNHAVSVLRVRVGDLIQVTDGRGTIYECQCADVRKQSISCNIQNKTVIPRIIPELTLLVGLPDKEHFETILEHATALGVRRVVPLIMDHCRKPWWESWDKLSQRFTSKMIVSMKQCLYPCIPHLDAPVSLGNVIDTCDKPLIVAGQHGKKLSDADISPYKKLTCLIGPPGGMSSGETKLLELRNPLIISVAAARLRTELASAAVCSRIMSAFLCPAAV
ncbi:MAG: 16S rRNA (uracil(1498)-N(3))-methyltransferase [Chitinispirillia bacterium]|nr:16S rRNA (uracil(1498)-N(3))-methyltransferase [Chitinispirillia bacterium]MCL2242424.1 16S rRNA (uracil(1498)-N(3))-methyltransferase [Chitinispirillia bacterium]